jgi:WhiB family transcriptional regulator, redox-sensing transcriptional regulator
MNLPESKATAGADWRSQSACKDSDPELFFPLSAWGPSLTQLATAKAICARCEVTAECLRFALSSGQEYGVWGGTSEDERKAMRRAQNVVRPIPVAGQDIVRPMQVAGQPERTRRSRHTQPSRLASAESHRLANCGT